VQGCRGTPRIWMEPGEELFHQTRFERLQTFMYSDVEVLELTSKYIRDKVRVPTEGTLQVMAEALSHVRKEVADQISPAMYNGPQT